MQIDLREETQRKGKLLDQHQLKSFMLLLEGHKVVYRYWCWNALTIKWEARKLFWNSLWADLCLPKRWLVISKEKGKRKVSAKFALCHKICCCCLCCDFFVFSFVCFLMKRCFKCFAWKIQTSSVAYSNFCRDPCLAYTGLSFSFTKHL